jgi:uracil phosphoribosyltransferase
MSVRVQTPLAECAGYRIGERIGLMPILRAGLGMAEAILDLVPDARVWHLGLYRDHETLKPVTYYSKLPPVPNIDLSIIVDPMLATGGSAVMAVDILKRWGARRIKFLGLLAAPEGVEALQRAHPDVPIHLAAIDSHLDERCYIVPGLGDAGDRQFGTG